ncbi:hypothetical protein JY96_14890 [Aquabacterium sp. NJ1]|uniref:hypothetical protein n=1 Tax=Aquabacterium sp. NJ1 TaxID=1538295 RepID=UPI00052DF3A5|nr:hypothetical protein [Aquabacterium sp. NJ1]KGM40898.1 hypothetical protein JY96_14890 [Aquabacterium sp. NJ1]
MFRHLVIVTCAALLGHTAAAQSEAASAPPNPFFLEAADCAAAFEARVIERKAQPRSEARNQAILHDTELGFVYIGVAYRRGLRNPAADEMLKAAEKRWSQLSKRDQAKRLASCVTQAEQLMEDVSGLERFIVKNRASARVDRLLEKEAQATQAKP